jgi:very-short-patch-repair endonuclease
MKDSKSKDPADWKEWKSIYQNTIRHSQFEWNFAIDVIPNVKGLKPSQVIPQHPFIGKDGREYHMDFAIVTERVKIAIELEGYDKTNTGTGKTKKEHDEFNRRIQDLTHLGWKVLTITNAQFMADKMGYANEIRQLMSEPQPEVVVVANQDNSETLNLLKKLGAAGIAVLVALLAVLIFSLSRNGDSPSPTPVSKTPVVAPERFNNCEELNRKYPGGIARSQEDKDKKTWSNPVVNRSVYDANSERDGNNDGVMCDSK